MSAESDIMDTLRSRPEIIESARVYALGHLQLVEIAASEQGEQLPDHRREEIVSGLLQRAMLMLLTDPRTVLGRHFLCDWAADNDVRFEIEPYEDSLPKNLVGRTVTFSAPYNHYGDPTMHTVDVEPESGETPQGIVDTFRTNFWRAWSLRHREDEEDAAGTLLSELGRILEKLEAA